MAIIKKLNKQQFAEAIAKGLGRAMMHIQHYGLDDMADIVLDACIHNTTYDAQCECGKEKWLYEMFKDTSYYNKFRDAILSALEKTDEWKDVGQLCDLVIEMALDGDGLARKSLKEFVVNSAISGNDFDYMGVEEYVQIEGETEVLQLAEIYGQRLINNPEDSVPEVFTYDEEERKKYNTLLKENSYSNNKIKVFFDCIDEDCGFDSHESISEEQRAIERENRKSEFISLYNAEKIIQIAVDGSNDSQWFYNRFGRYADENELKIVFSRLLEEKDNNVRRRLLGVFRSVAMPEVHEKFFELANDKDEKFRAAIILALANCKDEKVHEFACDRIRQGKIIGWPDHLLFDFFVKNYIAGDATKIMEAILNSKADKWDVHSYGMSVIGIAEMNETKELKELLLWVYENTPCTNCRADSVACLEEIGELSREILDECAFDCSEEIRDSAKDILEKK
ncbi:MAG: HEAT repeat domain-containing protein [Planctomycetaceae bacterium]|nr:HEAT repeat domain-containing protein [Planctomycetaceae bacterium]